MFRETLIESSPAVGKTNRWPIATSFVLQLIVASALVLLSLMSTGILPTSMPMPVPPTIYTPLAAVPRSGGGHAGSAPVSPMAHAASTAVVSIHNLGSLIFGNKPRQGTEDSCPGCPTGDAPQVGGGGPAMPTGLLITDLPKPKPPERVVMSHLSEALLVKKVVPQYPAIAIRAGVHGDVRLHAIIATDGSVQSLSLIDGPPLLAGAAIDAVRQWRYQPYVLNGQKIEVETFITVTFKRND